MPAFSYPYRRDPVTGLMSAVLPPIATDQKTVAERKWRDGSKASKPQKACDIGLFGDEADQMDLIEMCQDPTNGE